MRCLGNGDASAGRLADLADLTTTTANDTADHVRGNADILRLHLFAIFGVRGGGGRFAASEPERRWNVEGGESLKSAP